MITLSWILAIGLLGPLLASPKRFGMPVAVGEILVGVAFGESGFKKVPVHSVTFALLANIGFALVMLIAGSHINISKIFRHKSLAKALLNQVLVLLLSTIISLGIVRATHFYHLGLVIVLVSSSSAAIILPIFGEAGDQDPNLELMLVQVAIADLMSVIAIPLVISRKNLARTVEGSFLIGLCALLIFILLLILRKKGQLRRMQEYSKSHNFRLELRFSLIILLALAGVAQRFSLSVMIAGFTVGLAIAPNQVSHRLGRQFFALAEGFLAPFYFVWLGAEIDIRATFSNTHHLALALFLGIGALVAHLATLLTKSRFSFAIISSAQLGVPVAAVSIGQAANILTQGESGAIMLGALISIIAITIASSAIKKI